MSRNFEVRYGNWPIAKATVPANMLPADEQDSFKIVRRAMGHAFMEQLKGDWPEHEDCKVVLDKASPGVYCGRRQHPKSGQKDDSFYILEV